jgi:hypothetical protein
VAILFETDASIRTLQPIENDKSNPLTSDALIFLLRNNQPGHEGQHFRLSKNVRLRSVTYTAEVQDVFIPQISKRQKLQIL